MSTLHGGMDALGPVPHHTPPPNPADVTTHAELEAAVWEAMRGMKSTLGSAPRRERVAEILTACRAYAAVQIAAAVTPAPRSKP